jgi:formylglycine-generating enzyme required for sulfatase activity
VYLIEVDGAGQSANASRGAAKPPRTAPNDGIDMVFVEGGTFTMGCTPEQGNDCFDWEKPTHRVTVSDFYIGRYEVTQAQWTAVMGNNPSHFKGDNRPVEQVGWNDVQEFVNRLNAITGRTYRLPTEAEWEYAARGGNKPKFCPGGCKYAGSNDIDNVGWYNLEAKYGTQPVGRKAPNELGLYDMSGNVYEWVNDWYGTYSAESQRNPNCPTTGSYRVARGGSWISAARFARVSYRDYDEPGDRIAGLGFRLARSSE